jgi:hypothetical protein
MGLRMVSAANVAFEWQSATFHSNKRKDRFGSTRAVAILQSARSACSPTEGSSHQHLSKMTGSKSGNPAIIASPVSPEETVLKAELPYIFAVIAVMDCSEG